MPDISQLTSAATLGAEDPDRELFEAEVVEDATGPLEEVRCVIPAFSAEHADDGYTFTPLATGDGGFWPKKGCRAVVAFPDEGEPFIDMWRPLDGAAPDEAVGGGLPGPEGPEGPEGKEGPKGDTGATGAAGAVGATGAAGAKGSTGEKGATGERGETGSAGPSSGGLILVRATTTAVLAANTAPTATTLEASANGALASQDGIALAVGDRLLVKNEGTGSKNGVYEVTSLGAAGSKWKLSRISSMDESSEVVPGMRIIVAQGAQWGGVEFGLLTTGTITLGTTALTFGYAGGWIEPTLTNFKNYESAGFPKCAYRKSTDNRVTIRGLIQPTVTGQHSPFALPEGFRPTSQGANGLGFATVAGNGSGDVLNRAEILPSGVVFPTVSFTALTATFYWFLDGISFYAD